MRRPRRTFATDAYGQIRAEDAAVQAATRTQLQRQARSGALNRPFRGVYVVPGSPAADDDLRPAMTHLGAHSLAIIGSAARTLGLHGLPPRWIPQIALPPGMERRQRPGVEIRIWDVPDDQITLVDGLRTTTALRTVADSCRLLTRMQAVSVADSALNLGLLTLEDLAAADDLMARQRSCRTGRARLREARLGAQSPGETRVRLILADAGLPPDALQVPIRDADGRLLGYGDLGYALPSGGWLVIEFDGRSIHDRPEALLNDRHRQNAFQVKAGAQMLRFAWEDTRSADTIPAVVGPLLRAAGWTPSPTVSFQAPYPWDMA